MEHMTAEEWKPVLAELMLAYPTLAGDTERRTFLREKLKFYKPDEIRQALGEYLLTGEKFMETARFVAITHRIARQRLDKEADTIREQMKAHERERDEQIRSGWNKADTRLDGFSDQELAELKAEVIAANPNLAKLLEHTDPRTGRMTKALIIEHLKKARGRTIMTIEAD